MADLLVADSKLFFGVVSLTMTFVYPNLLGPRWQVIDTLEEVLISLQVSWDKYGAP